MKILFLTDNFPPESNAPATRTFEHCREWVRLGAHVTVITCAPNFPQGKVFPGYANSPYKRDDIAGIQVIRVWSYMAPNAGFARRILDYLSFAGSSLVAGAFVDADVIVATSPQFFTTLGGLGLSIGRGKPWVFELRDLWPESIRAVSALSSTYVLDLLTKLELFLYRHANMIVAVTPAFKKTLVARGIDEAKIKVVTNGADLSVYKPREPDSELRLRFGLQGKFVIGYVGTHGMAHNLEGLVSAFENCVDRNTVFVLIGDGARKEAIREIIVRKNLLNVLLLDPVAKEEIVRYWSIMDLAIVPLRKDPIFTSVIPSKIFEAAAMGKPILLGVEGQARELIEQYDAGLCYEPENTVEFLAKVDLLRVDRALYSRLSTNCVRLAMDYDRSTLAVKMYEHLCEVVAQHRQEPLLSTISLAKTS